jgi:thioredoxin reductase (NADPH)
LVRDLNVAVTGGGNSAGQAAIHLAKFARHVTLIVRGNSLNKDMSDYLVNQIKATPNIEVRVSTDIIGGDGRDRLERITVRDKTRNVVDGVPAELLFALIGATPQTDWLDGTVQRDAKGFIRTGHEVDLDAFPPARKPGSFETSLPGVFAVGDVRLGSTKRVATAVGDSAGAVQNIHQYIEDGERAARGKRQNPAPLYMEANLAPADAANSATQSSRGASTLAIRTDIVTSAPPAEASAAGTPAERPAAGEAA